MGQAIGNVLPLAVAVAIFPVPIIAVVLLLGSDRGLAKGVAFVVAWGVGLAGVGAIALVLGGVAEASLQPGAARSCSVWACCSWRWL
jgi:Sap, sulfolipid-1-addressing protein